MIRFSRHFYLLSSFAVLLASCSTGASTVTRQAPFQGQGRYVYPDYQRPIPTQYIPQTDLCRAQLYQGLRGQHIGGVHLVLIAGDKRIIQPAELETDEDDFLMDMRESPPFVTVTELLAGQPLYAASIRTGVFLGQIGPDQEDRLTIELDAEGYISELTCR